jgi:hypothetical protein
MIMKETFYELTESALKKYERENGKPFPMISDTENYWWEDMQALTDMIHAPLDKHEAVVWFEPWIREDVFCAYESPKLMHTIIIDSDARVHCETYKELKDELWYFQKMAQEIEERIIIKGTMPEDI